MGVAVLIIGLFAVIASFVGMFADRPRISVPCRAAFVASMVFCVFTVRASARDERNDRIRGAQACVDAGGTPFRSSEHGGITCLDRSQP